MAMLAMLAPGLQATTTWYVWQNIPNNGPGDSWADAFHDIQSAVNITTNGDTVLVTNGIYNTGGTAAPGNFLTNRVNITNLITLQSVNGPGVTMIVGATIPGLGFTNNARCVYMVTNSVLSGFTLSTGATWYWGIGNPPSSGGPSDFSGGGVIGGILTNCALINNQASVAGGAAYSRIVLSRTTSWLRTALAGAGGPPIALYLTAF